MHRTACEKEQGSQVYWQQLSRLQPEDECHKKNEKLRQFMRTWRLLHIRTAGYTSCMYASMQSHQFLNSSHTEGSDVLLGICRNFFLNKDLRDSCKKDLTPKQNATYHTMKILEECYTKNYSA